MTAKQVRTAIGLMSGTSMDGIDAAVLRSDGDGFVERGPSAFFPYEAAFRHQLEAGLAEARAITRREDRPGALAALEAEITRRHAEAIAAFRPTMPPAFSGIDLIGFHGQTVLHRPAQGLTVQLGDGKALADATGIDVVYDMRARDMAEGGQGAPLVPVYHEALVSGLAGDLARLPVALVNIGGISNITYVDGIHSPVAFDCGPGNTLIDQWVQLHAGIPYDQDGKIASEGHVIEAVAETYLADPFFARPVPKSLDRGDFTLGPVAGLELADGARTLAAVTARAIYRAARHLKVAPRLWILCGGGRRNACLVEELAALARRDDADVVRADDAGLDGDAMEAEAWAYLAIRSQRGLPLTYPSTTGCRRPVSGGRLARAGSGSA